MTDLITRIRHVEDTAQWIDSSTGEIVEAVKLSDLQAVPMDDLADCAHQLNETLDARDAAVAHVRELEAEVQHSHDERDALRAKLVEAEKLSESWPCRECVANKNGRCETAGMPVENELDEEYCPDFTRRMPVVAQAKDCRSCTLTVDGVRVCTYNDDECSAPQWAYHRPRPAALKGTDQ